MKLLIRPAGFILLALFLCSSPGTSWSLEGYGIYINDINTLNQLLSSAEAELAKSPGNPEALKRAGISAHQLAYFKGKGYSEKSAQYLSDLLEKTPDDAVVMAYLGSAYAMVARDGSAVMTKISNLNKGISLLNRAVRQAPDDFVVRMVRGSVIFELPSMFKNTQNGIADFAYAESRFDSLPDTPGVNISYLKAEVYYKLGSLKKEVGEKQVAASYFKKSIEADPGSKWAKLAKKE